jgi:hypothetical protein
MVPFTCNTQKRQISKDITQIADCQRLRAGRNEKQLLHGYGASFEGNENVLKLDRNDGCTFRLIIDGLFILK